jgi:DNA invertase Pin-like site-specific DNA recombinase
MGKIFGYCRVSTSAQDEENQRLAIGHADEWISSQQSSRRSQDQRGITELLSSVSAGDVIIVTELSRLARSTSELLLMVDEMTRRGIGLIVLKQGINIPPDGAPMDPTTKMTVTIFGLMAELERDFISIRTRMGLEARRAAGVTLGKPRGTRQPCKLDPVAHEVVAARAAGKSVTALAAELGVGRGTLRHYLRSRGF